MSLKPERAAKTSVRSKDSRKYQPRAAFVEFTKLAGGLVIEPEVPLVDPVEGVPQLVDITAFGTYGVIGKLPMTGKNALIWARTSSFWSDVNFFFDKPYKHVSAGLINLYERPIPITLLVWDIDEVLYSVTIDLPVGESTVVLENHFEGSPGEFLQLGFALREEGYAAIDFLTII